MTKRPSDRLPDPGAQRIRELGEDLNVALMEFLERHPETSSGEVQEAFRLGRQAARVRMNREGVHHLIQRILEARE